jgi:MobA/VirD2-like, nuclease domain/Large polyvalent protein-associated domain 7/TraI-like middle domain
MIGKVITLRKRTAAKGAFRDAVNYIARDGPEDPPQDRIPASDMGVINLDADVDTAEDRRNVWSAMRATALTSQRLKGSPVYHLSLSWHEHEHPDREQVMGAVRHVMGALGMAECEAIWAIHRDTINDHVHLVVNRVHPEHATVAGPPWRDYWVLDRAMREIELAQGWCHTPGMHVVCHSERGAPEIVRLSRSRRRALGLLNEATISHRAKQASHSAGAPSFQEWVVAAPAQVLADTVEAADATWASVHKAAARFGLRLKTKGSGMVIVSRLGDRVVGAKASLLGPWASKRTLERRLGPFHPSDLDGTITETTYAQFLTSRQQGGIPVSRPADSADTMQRQARREARAQERAELYDRYCQERRVLTSRRKAERVALRARQQQDREQLRLASRALKVEFSARRKAAGASAVIAASLCAFLTAQEKRAMQARHARERVALTRRLPSRQAWRHWLERQAGRGDEAAKAVLRGIRFCEQCRNYRDQNGFEGEELDPLRPLQVGLTAELDPGAMCVHYRDAAGRAAFSDSGPRIDVHDQTDEALMAALHVAATKFGAAVAITGSAAFRRRAARMAARLGTAIGDPDLKEIGKDERTRRPMKPGASQEQSLDVDPEMPGHDPAR